MVLFSTFLLGQNTEILPAVTYFSYLKHGTDEAKVKVFLGSSYFSTLLQSPISAAYRENRIFSHKGQSVVHLLQYILSPSIKNVIFHDL